MRDSSLSYACDSSRTYHVVLVRASVVLLGACDVEQDVGEGLDGVDVAAHHEIRKAHVVVERDLSRCHSRVQTLFVRSVL